MLKELINNLKNKKSRLCSLAQKEAYDKNDNSVILISEINNIIKIEISDYITITDYVEKLKIINKTNLLNLISNNILWNSVKQKVNKGVFFVIQFDNYIYNILINEESLKIDQRFIEGNISEEKIINFNINNNEYNYCSLIHDKTDTIFVKNYDKKTNLGLLELSTEETYEDVSIIIYKLESIKDIDKILNIELLKKYILDDLKNEVFKQKLK